MPDLPYFISMLHMLAPRAVILPLNSAEEAFGSGRRVNATALPAERGSAWTLLYPQYSVVVPEGTLVKVPLAYPVARHDEAFATFINTWIDLKRKDGTLDRLYKYWIVPLAQGVHESGKVRANSAPGPCCRGNATATRRGAKQGGRRVTTGRDWPQRMPGSSHACLRARHPDPLQTDGNAGEVRSNRCVCPSAHCDAQGVPVRERLQHGHADTRVALKVEI